MHKLNSHSQGFTLIEVMVALSLLALSVAGLAQVRQAGFRHMTLTQEIQYASYLADSHLSQLNTSDDVRLGFHSGEYHRGSDTYPWQLNLAPINERVLQPQSNTLSKKVDAVTVDLSVWVDKGSRELRFHTLMLRTPLALKENARSSIKLAEAK